MFLHFVEDGQIAELKDQMQFLLASKHFDQVHQVRMFQLLQRNQSVIIIPFK